MVKVLWTEFAIEDLKSIHDYISKDSKVYATRFVEKIMLRVDQLEANPKSGRIVPEFNIETLRELIEGNYRIIYKIDSDFIGIVSSSSFGSAAKEHVGRQLLTRCIINGGFSVNF